MNLLRRPGLGPLLGAEVISSIGSQMTYLALPWFVLVTTGSASRMGIVLGVELLPIGLFGIPSGAVVGKLGARRTMMVEVLHEHHLVPLLVVNQLVDAGPHRHQPEAAGPDAFFFAHLHVSDRVVRRLTDCRVWELIDLEAWSGIRDPVEQHALRA